MAMLRLPELQRAMFRAITGAAGRDDADPALLADVQGDARLGADARLEIYGRMYRARLVDVLFEDYPRVAATLGHAPFVSHAEAYVANHASTHPSLRWFGAGFAEHLAATVDAALPPFVPDLARLEWARLGAFDAPDAALLTVDALRALAPEGWTTLRLHVVPALEILVVAWPVHRIWEAAGEGRAGGWSASPTVLRVWRQGDAVYQASMDEVERAALAHVRAGSSFVDMCAELATVVAADEAAATAGALVLRWLEDGLLRAD